MSRFYVLMTLIGAWNIAFAQSDQLVLGDPHPTMGGYIFYLNGLGGGLIAYDEDLRNSDFDDLSMFRWCEPDHLRTETNTAYFNFNDWAATSAHSDQTILDAYGSDGSYAALAVHDQLGSPWRLPTSVESYWMYINLGRDGKGDFVPAHYWTSSETLFNDADIPSPYVVAIDMKTGIRSADMAKMQALRVRPVRSF